MVVVGSCRVAICSRFSFEGAEELMARVEDGGVGVEKRAVFEEQKCWKLAGGEVFL